MVCDLSMLHDIIQGLIGDVAEILVDLEQREIGVSHGGASGSLRARTFDHILR